MLKSLIPRVRVQDVFDPYAEQYDVSSEQKHNFIHRGTDKICAFTVTAAFGNHTYRLCFLFLKTETASFTVAIKISKLAGTLRFTVSTNSTLILSFYMTHESNISCHSRLNTTLMWGPALPLCLWMSQIHKTHITGWLTVRLLDPVIEQDHITVCSWMVLTFPGS